MTSKIEWMGAVLLAAAVGACESRSTERGTMDVGVADATAQPPGPPPAPLDLAGFEQLIFNGANTEGVVVHHEGRLVYEKYAGGYDATKRHLAYSVSKSVGGALLGIAIDEHLLGLRDSICQYVPAPTGADPRYCETTIQDLAQMTSGLAWDEGYADPNTSNVLPMLYGDEADTGLYVALRRRRADAGTRWQYSSGDSNLLARAIRSALNGRDMRAWAREKLFAPAHLDSAIFESDRSGTLLFSSGLFMTPRDMARFGQLYLDDGKSGSTRVLASSWVAFSVTPAPAVSTPRPHVSDNLGERGGSYGVSLWLNAATSSAPLDTLLYHEAPRDTFCAQGQWGQRVCVVPSRRLVVVRVGNDRQGFYDIGPAVEAAVTAVDKTKEQAR